MAVFAYPDLERYTMTEECERPCKRHWHTLHPLSGGVAKPPRLFRTGTLHKDIVRQNMPKVKEVPLDTAAKRGYTKDVKGPAGEAV